jgi:hypothetical protein
LVIRVRCRPVCSVLDLLLHCLVLGSGHVFVHRNLPFDFTGVSTSALSRETLTVSLRRLSDLPAELTCLILQGIDSTLDLYSFIRASPQVYAAFLSPKQPILFNLLQRAVSAEVLRLDAQITLRSSQFPIPPYHQISENLRNPTPSSILSGTSTRLILRTTMSRCAY